jgi:hypothetical protein
VPPKTVFIIRHAEKPFDPGDKDLTFRGRLRAAVYAAYFNHKLNDAFPQIDAIYAAANAKRSHRPVQTVKPLAAALGLEISTEFADKAAAELGERLRAEGAKNRTVLVCWHHEHIPALVEALGAKPPLERWPGHAYDMMWQVDFESGGPALTVREIPLLAGD